MSGRSEKNRGRLAPAAPAKREAETFRIVWQGIEVEIVYQPDWLNSSDGPYPRAHLTITSISPNRAPLPITETGYRSHFLTADLVADYGGPEAYVRAWLDHEAGSKAWKRKVVEARQLRLL